MHKKVIVTGDESREKLLRGVNLIGDIVGATIGPAGRNAIIYRKYHPPLITNDGVTIARMTYLSDEIEDLGAQTVVEAAMKTNYQAGDGTTTSVVIAVSLINKCFKEIKESSIASLDRKNPMSMFRAINSSKERVVQMLKEKTKELEDSDLEKVILTSLENHEFGKTLTQMIRDVGENGYISVEDNWATQYGITTETILGMKFLGTYVTPYMVTNQKREAVIEDAPIIVANGHIEEIKSLEKIIDELKKQGKAKLVIFAEGFSRPLTQSLAEIAVKAHQGKAIQVLAIKAPSLTTEQFKDVAVYCKADFWDVNAGKLLKDIPLHALGTAKKIVVNEDDVIIQGGAGDVTKHIEDLKAQLELERDLMFQEKLKRRIASLSSGIGIIRVGAMTESERDYLKFKIEDAVNAGRAALAEGVVKGGGLALKEIAEELGEEDILYDALLAPYKKIQENAGGSLEISDDVLDPVKVTRLAVENACSVAGVLITTESAIGEKYEGLWDKLEDKLITLGMDKEWDSRDSSNQDLGAGRLVA